MDEERASNNRRKALIRTAEGETCEIEHASL